MHIKACLRPTFESVYWLVAAALLAAGMQAVIAARAYSINVDGLTFIAIAQQLEHDPVATIRKHDQHPGYPALILLAERTLELFGCERDPWSWTLATRMAAATCGVLSVVAMWLFSRRLFGVQCANIAALAFVALPIFRMNASDALSDTPHLLFYLLAAWCAVEGFATRRVVWWMGCGVLGGVAFWFRPEGLEPPLIVGLLLACQLLRGGVTFRYGARSLATVACGMLLIVVPYIVLAGKFTSKQLPFAKKESAPLFLVTETAAELRQMEKATAGVLAAEPETVASAAIDEVPPAATAASQPPATLSGDLPPSSPKSTAEDSIAAAAAQADVDSQHEPSNSPPAASLFAEGTAEPSVEPTPAPTASASAPLAKASETLAPSVKPVVTGRVVWRLAGKAFMHFIKNMVWGLRFALVPMYLLGNWEMIRRRVPWWSIAMPAGMGCLHIAVLFGVYFLSGYIDQRHVMPVVAMTIPFAALGMLYVAEVLCRFLPQRIGLSYALATVVVVSCGTVIPRSFTPMNPELEPVFFATSWIRANARPGDAVISNTDYVGFYAQTPSAHLQNGSRVTVETAMLQGPPNVRYRFAVLDLGIYGYCPEWRQQMERDFQEVLRLEDPRSKRDEPKLLVYLARDKHGVRAEEEAPAAASSAAQSRLSAIPAAEKH